MIVDNHYVFFCSFSYFSCGVGIYPQGEHKVASTHVDNIFQECGPTLLNPNEIDMYKSWSEGSVQVHIMIYKWLVSMIFQWVQLSNEVSFFVQPLNLMTFSKVPSSEMYSLFDSSLNNELKKTYVTAIIKTINRS
jgi:hypothetical protein